MKITTLIALPILLLTLLSFQTEIVQEKNSALAQIGAISGCTVPKALNYNPNATVDDGSCLGCRDKTNQDYVGDSYVNKIKPANDRCINNNQNTGGSNLQCLDIIDPDTVWAELSRTTNQEEVNRNGILEVSQSKNRTSQFATLNKPLLYSTEKSQVIEYDDSKYSPWSCAVECEIEYPFSKNGSDVSTAIHSQGACDLRRKIDACNDPIADNYVLKDKFKPGNDTILDALEVDANTVSVHDPSTCMYVCSDQSADNFNDVVALGSKVYSNNGDLLRQDDYNEIFCRYPNQNNNPNNPTTDQGNTNQNNQQTCYDAYDASLTNFVCRDGGAVQVYFVFGTAVYMCPAGCTINGNPPTTTPPDNTPNITDAEKPNFCPEDTFNFGFQTASDNSNQCARGIHGSQNINTGSSYTPSQNVFNQNSTPSGTSVVDRIINNIKEKPLESILDAITTPIIPQTITRSLITLGESQPIYPTPLTQPEKNYRDYLNVTGKTDTPENRYIQEVKETINGSWEEAEEIARTNPSPFERSFKNIIPSKDTENSSSDYPNTFVPNIQQNNSGNLIQDVLGLSPQAVTDFLGKINSSGVKKENPSLIGGALTGNTEITDPLTGEKYTNFAEMLSGIKNNNSPIIGGVVTNFIPETIIQKPTDQEKIKLTKSEPETKPDTQEITPETTEENEKNYEELADISKKEGRGILPESNPDDESVIDSSLFPTGSASESDEPETKNANTELVKYGPPTLEETFDKTEGDRSVVGTTGNEYKPSFIGGAVGEILGRPSIELETTTEPEQESTPTNKDGKIIITEKISIDKTLKKGSEGKDVEKLQTFLSATNYLDKSNINGTFDKETGEALEKFQKDWDLTPDQISGPNTNGVIETISETLATYNQGLIKNNQTTTDDSKVKIEKTINIENNIAAYTDGNNELEYLSPVWHQDQTSSGIDKDIPSVVIPLGPGREKREIVKDENGDPVAKLGDVFIAKFTVDGKEVSILTVAGETGGIHGPGGRFGEREWGEISISTVAVLKYIFGLDINVGVNSLSFPEGTEFSLEKTNLNILDGDTDFESVVSTMSKNNQISDIESPNTSLSSASDKGSIDAYIPSEKPTYSLTQPSSWIDYLKDKATEFSKNWTNPSNAPKPSSPIIIPGENQKKQEDVTRIIGGLLGQLIIPAIKLTDLSIAVNQRPDTTINSSDIETGEVPQPETDPYADFPGIKDYDPSQAATNEDIFGEPLPNQDVKTGPVETQNIQSTNNVIDGIVGSLFKEDLFKDFPNPNSTNGLTPENPDLSVPESKTESELIRELQQKLNQQEITELPTKATVIPFANLDSKDQNNLEIIDLYKQLNLFPGANYVEGESKNNAITPSLPKGSGTLPSYVMEILKMKPVISTTGKEPQKGVIPTLIENLQK